MSSSLASKLESRLTPHALLALWGVGWLHLLVVVILLAWQPLSWSWWDWRDPFGLGLIALAIVWSRLPNWLPAGLGLRVPTALQQPLVTLGFPAVIWLGLLGHQSLSAQSLSLALLVAGQRWFRTRPRPISEPPLASPGARATESPQPTHLAPSTLDSNPNELGRADFSPSSGASEDSETPSSRTCLQHWERFREADLELLEGTVWVEFAPGQQTAIVQAPIWPPLPGTPEIEAEPEEGPLGCRVKVTSVAPHGFRLEVRLSEPAEDAWAQGVHLNLAAALTEPPHPVSKTDHGS